MAGEPSAAPASAGHASNGNGSNTNNSSNSNGNSQIPSISQQSPAKADEVLQCQWNGCGERAPSAEQLYDHVCERHVGRKSTNNLNLTCGWGTCRTTTVKRDHITSHIRVHVPLKPHKCDFCGKSFKRPQDLKKHVKTHADDSVLLRSPEPGSRQRDQNYVRYENGKIVNTDLQQLAATATGYYENPLGHNIVGNQQYNQQAPNGNQGYYGGQPQGYGHVYYSVSHGGDVNHQASFDARKRGMDTLNDFLGDAKRRQIDPTNYGEVGQRLMALQGLQLPSHGPVPQLHSTPAMVAAGGVGGSGPQHQYALPPMPNARTKNDLMNIDQFLEQMQSTVYESSNQAAAAGVAQPGVHYNHVSLPSTHAQNHSPPHVTASSSVAPVMVASSSETTSNGTPALTPPSSTLSYNSAHSPSVHGMSPNPRTTAGAYPSLPPLSSATEMSSGYSSSHNAPTSTLGPDFDPDQRRRYSGGMLQKARPASESGSDHSDKTASPGSHTREVSKDTDIIYPDLDSVKISSSVTSPALESVASPGAESMDGNESLYDKAQEAWIENMRTIERLRTWVMDRLDNHEYEDETSPKSPEHGKSQDEMDAESLYPILKAIEG